MNKTRAVIATAVLLASLATLSATDANAQAAFTPGVTSERGDVPGNVATGSLASCLYRAGGLTVALAASQLGPLKDGQAIPIACDANGNLLVTGASGGGGSGVGSTIISVTTTQGQFFTSATGSTYTLALAASGTAQRKGCTIQNTSAGVEYVYFGTNAPTSLGVSLQMASGTPLTCDHGGVVVAQDNVWIASAAANASYVLEVQ